MLRNTSTEWGWPAKALHWLAAAAIIVLLVHGWWMTHLAARGDRLANYNLHAAIGYDLLALLILRLLWRWLNQVPALPADLKPWERIAAQAGHIGLYVLMFGASVTGWGLAGTFRTPMNRDLAGLPIPQFVQDRGWHEFFEESHKVLAYLLAILLVAHIAGALRHHFVKHNDVMRRIWFGRGTA